MLNPGSLLCWTGAADFSIISQVGRRFGCIPEEKPLRTQLVRSMAMALVSALLFSAPALADTYSFSVVPAGGAIEGAPGSLIGWGYSITNDSSTYWLEALALNAGSFQFATFDSFDYFDFPLVAPDSTATESFSRAGSSGFGTGIAALTWDRNAPAGFSNVGDFDLSACWANSQGKCIQVAPDSFAAYSATIPGAPGVPEPPSLKMLALAALLFSIVVSILKPLGFVIKPFSG